MVILLSVVAWFLASCTKTIEPDETVFGYEYYSMRVGQQRVYHVQQVVFDVSGKGDTINYLVKEVVEDSLEREDGTYSYVLGRYSAPLNSNDWQKDSLWATQIHPTNVTVEEANTPFVKLIFPVEVTKKWDGNALNAKDEELYELISVGDAYMYDSLQFTNTCKVVHKDLRDPAKITSDDYRYEVFAFGVGLVHRYKLKLNYCSTCQENGVIEGGYILDQKLISFETK